jgi:SAM-dependent methyltransferase
MNQNMLYDEYKHADIVSEHFGKGSIGMGAMDAMAVGRPIIANGSPEIFTRALGETPPICHATNAEEVRSQLVRLAVDRNLREAIGKQSRSFVEKYCAPEHAARMVLEKLEQSKLKMQHLRWFCPKHGHLLEDHNQVFKCPEGCSFPLLHNILCFVPQDNYASSFGLQWNEYRTTQLDSHTGLTISRDRLTRLLGGSLDVVNGKKVLEAGCGAGRFTEILLASGAHVWAVDISSAVEANYRNCSSSPNYAVAQASILDLPFEPEQFDIVVCIGVIQHTPDPEMTMRKLCEQVKPGGLLVIDHYTYGYASMLSRRMLRALLLKTPSNFSLGFCKTLTNLLWPWHRIFWKMRNLPFLGHIRNLFIKLSPLVDYHDAYPQLGPKLLKIWAALDTHDTLTDHYKHLRNADEIRAHLHKCGMVDIETSNAGNGVEARAVKKR